MIALGVLFGIVLGVAALVFLMLFAALLTTGIYFIVPRLQETFAAVPFSVLWRHYRETLSRPLADKTVEPTPLVLVVLCNEPLTNPQYLVGLAGRHPVFTADKANAKRLELGDLAVKQWVYVLDQRHGYGDVFVCFAHPELRGNAGHGEPR